MTTSWSKHADISIAIIAGAWIPLRIVFFDDAGILDPLFEILFIGLCSIVATLKVIRLPRKTSATICRAIALEVIVALPLVTISKSYLGAPSELFFLVKMIALPRLLRIRDVFISMDTLYPVLSRLLPVVIFMPMMIHIICCGWLFLGSGTALREGGRLTEYIRAIYWTITTLCTVGYGDITPKTPAQMGYACLVMIVGVTFFGYVISNVASLMARLDAAKEHHLAVLDRVETFMSYNRVPHALKSDVRAFYRYLWESRQGYDDHSVLESLPPKLRSEIALSLNAEIINKVPILKGAEPELLRDVVLELQPTVALPGEKIFRLGEIGDAMYFIQRGAVEVISKTGKRLATLSDGAFFGEAALLTSNPRNAGIRALTYCTLHILRRSGFEKVLNRHPGFRDHVLEVARNRLGEDQG